MDKGYKVISDGTDNHLMLIDLIDEVISNIENEAVIKRVGDKVIDMMKAYPLFSM